MAADTPYFKIVKKPSGWRAYFYGRNGELVWWTEAYTSYANAEKAVKFCQNNAAYAPLR
jgi:uncharacterized protein YegP (UPF0339 family)